MYFVHELDLLGVLVELVAFPPSPEDEDDDRKSDDGNATNHAAHDRAHAGLLPCVVGTRVAT